MRNFYSNIPIDLYCCLIINKPDHLSNHKRLSFYYQTDCPAINYIWLVFHWCRPVMEDQIISNLILASLSSFYSFISFSPPYSHNLASTLGLTSVLCGRCSFNLTKQNEIAHPCECGGYWRLYSPAIHPCGNWLVIYITATIFDLWQPPPEKEQLETQLFKFRYITIACWLNHVSQSNNVLLVKIEGSVWYTIYHHLPVVKGVNKPLY